jgi:hypothetical protein
MNFRTAALSALLFAWLVQPAAAQSSAAGDARPDAATHATPAERTDPGRTAPAVKLPVDLARLQRRLQESAERDAKGAPKIRFDVSVYAVAPRIQILRPEDNLRYGQPRRSAPTHQDMMNLVTPQPFRHMPGMGLGSVINWFKTDPR